jgi:hypothetical protein
MTEDRAGPLFGCLLSDALAAIGDPVTVAQICAAYTDNENGRQESGIPETVSGHPRR